METKTALVTGADGGMGTIHTRTLAKAGYEVIMACIDAEAARHLMQVDLSNLQDVIRFANEVKQRFSSLQILLNNAGVLCHHAKNSVNGVEYTAAVNYLGHYTLTNALLPVMGEGTRIVSMISIAYILGKIKGTSFPKPTTKNSTGSPHTAIPNVRSTISCWMWRKSGKRRASVSMWPIRTL